MSASLNAEPLQAAAAELPVRPEAVRNSVEHSSLRALRRRRRVLDALLPLPPAVGADGVHRFLRRRGGAHAVYV